MYNILCCYVLVKLIKKHNRKFLASTRTFISKRNPVETATDPLDEYEAEFSLADKRVLFRKLDTVKAADIITIAVDYKYIKRLEGRERNSPRYLKPLADGHDLVSGPLYAGVIQAFAKKWGIFWSLIISIVTSGVILTVFGLLKRFAVIVSKMV